MNTKKCQLFKFRDMKNSNDTQSVEYHRDELVETNKIEDFRAKS